MALAGQSLLEGLAHLVHQVLHTGSGFRVQGSGSRVQASTWAAELSRCTSGWRAAAQGQLHADEALQRASGRGGTAERRAGKAQLAPDDPNMKLKLPATARDARAWEAAGTAQHHAPLNPSI